MFFFRDYWNQFWILVSLNLGDFIITKNFYDVIGSEAEATPWLRSAIVHHGIWSILWYKLAGLTALLILLSLFHWRELAILDGSYSGTQRRARCAKILAFANFWYLMVVLWGLKGFIR